MTILLRLQLMNGKSDKSLFVLSTSTTVNSQFDKRPIQVLAYTYQAHLV
jgi:hypothetical protein